jgi:mono/diheme cytochrome c family protein
MVRLAAPMLLATIAAGPRLRANAQDAAADLPEGAGKAIIRRACTTCHGVDEIAKLKGFYTADQWRDVVGTMVQYGAELKDGEADVLVDYLTKNFGSAAEGTTHRDDHTGAGGAGDTHK